MTEPSVHIQVDPTSVPSTPTCPLADLLKADGPGVVLRGKAYHLLEQPVVHERLRRPPDQHTIHPESGMHRALHDCAEIALTPTGPVVRMLLATHPAGSSPPPIGKVKEGTVYEQFFTTLPPSAITPADVLDLYLHRGSFETVLADEDQEQTYTRTKCFHLEPAESLSRIMLLTSC